MDPEDDFVGLCKAFINEHHHGDFDHVEISYRQALMRDCERGVSHSAGYFCDRWAAEHGNKVCVGDSWAVTFLQCARNTLYHPTYSCLPVITERRERPHQCEGNFGNPISGVTATKSQQQALHAEVGDMPMHLSFSSRDHLQPAVAAINGATAPWYPVELPGFGRYWSLTAVQAIEAQRDSAQRPHPALQLGPGERQDYKLLAGNTFAPILTGSERLIALGYWGFSGWWRQDLNRGALDLFDHVSGFGESGSTYARKSSHQAFGAWSTWRYSTSADVPHAAPAAGLPMDLSDHFGRSIRFDYGLVNNTSRVLRMHGTDGGITQFSYSEAGQLTAITWPDAERRVFHYEAFGHPGLLTGITAEDGRRLARYGYNPDGSALSTELAGGVQRFSLHYAQPPGHFGTIHFDESRKVFVRTIEVGPPVGAEVLNPEGISLALQVSSASGAPIVTGRSQPAGSGCAAATRRQAHDANGNASWREDFNGHRVCSSHDLTRDAELVRVEGLPSGSSCEAVAAVGVTLPVGARKISTQWHPDWNMVRQLAEPGRITTKIYNGQPDPFNGNVLTSCAPADALLPNRQPIVVLCKQVEQATLDSNGAQGFAAPLDAAVATRTQAWTYNQFGQVLTHDGPRTDLVDRTTNVYYSTTTADYTLGDLQQTTNAAGHTTRYPRYNKAGKPLQKIDPNGVVTDYSYDARQRLKTVSVAGLMTRFDYYPTGLLQRVTEPDGSYTHFVYDPAQRLTDVEDSKGNRIHYELDNSGNRKEERVQDAGGQLRRRVERAFDALNRIELTSGRE
ncbi:hypothetical protein [Inhella sp.]|uniref:hypothetical protein n=1 Tax=Inhella sp. TaxID=1921806 RepID=UPI0035AEF8E1